MSARRALLSDTLSVGLGAAFGGALRHICVCNAATLRASLARVCVVNVAGSFALGATQGLLRAGALHPRAALTLSAGLCGGLTTFSTLAAGALRAAREEGPRAAAAYALLSCALGVAAVVAGEEVARRGLWRLGKR